MCDVMNQLLIQYPTLLNDLNNDICSLEQKRNVVVEQFTANNDKINALKIDIDNLREQRCKSTSDMATLRDTFLSIFMNQTDKLAFISNELDKLRAIVPNIDYIECRIKLNRVYTTFKNNYDLLCTNTTFTHFNDDALYAQLIDIYLDYVSRNIIFDDNLQIIDICKNNAFVCELKYERRAMKQQLLKKKYVLENMPETIALMNKILEQKRSDDNDIFADYYRYSFWFPSVRSYLKNKYESDKSLFSSIKDKVTFRQYILSILKPCNLVRYDKYDTTKYVRQEYSYYDRYGRTTDGNADDIIKLCDTIEQSIFDLNTKMIYNDNVTISANILKKYESYENVIECGNSIDKKTIELNNMLPLNVPLVYIINEYDIEITNLRTEYEHISSTTK